jgi:drug/metabolite transporter (DMT)-like permease
MKEVGSPSTARPLDAVGVALMLLLCLTWGFNQVAVKLALPDIPPLIQATARSLGALLLVVVWARLRGVPVITADNTLAPGVAAGVLFGVEFVLIYRGLEFTTASRAVLFIYTAPFFVALGARWFLAGERIGAMQWLGLALSFAGVALAIGVPQPSVDAQVLLGDAMMIAAGAGWGATTLIIKASALAKAPPEKTLAWQLVVSVPILAAGAYLLGEKAVAEPRALALASLAWQTIWVVGFTYMIWFAMVKRYSASRLSAFTFLTPLFGVAAGHLVLDEQIAPAFAAAVVLVVAGLVLVNRRR